MNTQLELFDGLNTKVKSVFEKYHLENPEVYKLFKELAIEAKNIGHKHFSARGLFQVMRFKMPGDLKKDGYKYNNNYTPFYVRMIEKDLPSFKGFFSKRKSKADKIIS